jgi:C-terminal processing protease CtpA/Prc
MAAAIVFVVRGLFIMVACLSALFGGRLAAEPSQEIIRLIDQLADPAFTTRQRAAKDLRELADKHLMEVEMALASAYRGAGDPEVRCMSREILTALFTSRLGYLGIRYGKSEYTNPAGKNQCAIVIHDMQPNTAATKGGLLKGDLILSINGKNFTTAADAEWPLLFKSINSGSQVVLKIIRDGKEKRIPVILESWPFPLTPTAQSAMFTLKIAELAPIPLLNLPPEKSPETR